MATYEELMAAARKADQAGDAAGAKRLLEMAVELKSAFPPEVGGVSVNKDAAADLGNRLTVLGANASNAAAFGLGDEAMGLKAGLSGLMSGKGFGEEYARERDRVRGDMATVNAEYPSAATTGNIMGAMVPALAMSPLASGKTLLETGIRSTGLGAAEGAMQGAGNADGRGIVENAIRGAMFGGAAGLAAPAIVGAVRAAKNGALDPLTGIFGIANKSKANRALSGAMGRSGMTAADLDSLVAAATAAGQPEFRLVDALGLPGQRLASGIARSGGAPGDEVANFLATRQSGQPERVGAFLEDAYDVGGTTAAKTKEGLIESRRSTAKAEYDAAAANANPVDVRGAVTMLDDTISQMSGSGISPPRVVGVFNDLRKKLAGMTAKGEPTTLSDYKSVLAIWREVKDDIDKAFRAGDGSVGEALKPVRDALEVALADSSDMFRSATANYRAASGPISAVDEGATMASRGRAADNVSTFNAMPDASKAAARVGYGDELLRRMEGVSAPTSNRARPLGSPKRVAEGEAIAKDYPLLSSRLDRENTMWETMNRATGGSRTADNLADQEAVNSLAGGVWGAAKSGANFQFGDMFSKLGSALGPVAKGQNEATRALIAKALLSSNPSAALAPVIAQAGRSSAIRRALEAMLRQPIRQEAQASINGG